MNDIRSLKGKLINCKHKQKTTYKNQNKQKDQPLKCTKTSVSWH